MPRRVPSTQDGAPLLDVYLHDRHVGVIGETGGDPWFQYDEDIYQLGDERVRNQWSISCRLPVQRDPYDHTRTLVFFDNLLAESDTREYLAQALQRSVSDVPGLLGAVGGECIGAISLWPYGTPRPEKARYRPYDMDQLKALYNDVHDGAVMKAQLEGRQVMSGVQNKLVFRRVGSQYWLPINGAPGTWIVKRAPSRYDGLVANEMVCMRILSRLNVPAAHVEYISENLLGIERFDRYEDGGRVYRIHQEDMCQTTGRRPNRKYQFDGGPGLSDMALLLRRISVQAGADIGHLVTASLANIALGNMDAHAKNFAILYSDRGPQLAPLYDVVCTEAYAVLDHELSMQWGFTRRPSQLGPADLQRVAKQIGVTPAMIQRSCERVIGTLEQYLGDELHEVAVIAGQLPVFDRIEGVVRARIQDLKKMLS